MEKDLEIALTLASKRAEHKRIGNQRRWIGDRIAKVLVRSRRLYPRKMPDWRIEKAKELELGRLHADLDSLDKRYYALQEELA